MKKLRDFIILFLFVVVSCQSTTKNDVLFTDTIKCDTIITMHIQKDTIIKSSLIIIDEDTIKKPIFRKDIKPIAVDSSWRIKKDSSYQQLQKTEKIIKEQQKSVDSLIIKRK